MGGRGIGVGCDSRLGGGAYDQDVAISNTWVSWMNSLLGFWARPLTPSRGSQRQTAAHPLTQLSLFN